jgi:UDP-N-acetylglucosamine 2-epimerase (non-hydrolysing)
MPRFKKPAFWDTYQLKEQKYLIMTLHRPANVDQEANLKELIQTIIQSAAGLPVVFPVHPRTAKILEALSIEAPNLLVVEPLSYLEFNYLVKHSKGVITDSGGITEETTVMGVPCMTLRNNTERPETVELGTNELLGTDPRSVPPALAKLLSGNWKTGKIPPLWDGNAAERIVKHLLDLKNA